MKKLKYLLFVLLASIAVYSCSKDNNAGSGYLKVKLTDAPYDAQEVNVDIQQVVLHYSSDTVKPVYLNTKTAVYNLLNLQNGVDTLLAAGIVPAGTISSIRFILGNDNSIKINNEVYPLTVPSGAESGLKINLDKQVTSLDSLLIDFDAAMSVVKTGNDKYILKPVLKLK